ncbi:response regulator [Cohnella lupini]|uniref:Response regulator receiver and SARP domain protein n=1 Tax=Cohnella lupini TaxID=1294267 RepID=A0A3D9IBK6_9BACL|nr:response regulator [Cohnella lupini]RED58586.1 response regulator receiver and SARP domain protein [Cohnella lupini]
MKIVLIDDDPVMHLIMRKMLVKLPEVQVAGAFADTQSATEFLANNADIELAFVDISMPGESGMSFAAKMEEANSKVQIVFVTSHKEYALKAYDLSVMDYLVKPVSQERLERTVNRALAGRESARASRLGDSVARKKGEIIITALGDFSVQNESGRVKWISSKSAELFAYLLLNRGKRIARSRLVADIFGGMTSDSAEKYLNTTVYQLRKSLEPLGLREAVRSENDGYALELINVVIDYEEFEQRAGKPERMESSDADDFLQSERLYTGDLFGNKAYVWAIHETERLAELYANFVKQLSEALLSLRNTSAAMKLLLKLHARNPLDESVVRLLMRVHGQDGNKKGLTSQYTDYVKLLNKELGIRPSKELLLLYDSLVNEFADNKK